MLNIVTQPNKIININLVELQTTDFKIIASQN